MKVFLKIYFFKNYVLFIFLYWFDTIILKIIFLKIKKYYFNIFLNKRYFLNFFIIFLNI